MLNMNGFWPQITADSGDAPPADAFGLGTVMETQARLWNHMLDANRSLWELYMPWLSAGPSIWTAAFGPLQGTIEAVAESAPASGNGMSEAMDSQARSWNEFVDANRTFWAAFGWPLPGLMAGMGGNGAAGSESDAADTGVAPRTPARKSPRSKGR